MKKIILLLILFGLPLVYNIAASNSITGKETNSFAVVTYASDNVQERSTRVFIKSVRERSGKYSDSKIYVVLGDHENFPCESLKGENVILLSLEMDSKFKDYPLAIKAFAAAQVEQLVKDEVTTLAWFDPATLVLNSLDEPDLENKYAISIRPVSLLNTIGITPGSEPNHYWKPIYDELGLNYNDVPTIETVVDEKPVQAYYNCEIFSVDPRLGIFTKWAEVLTKLLTDENYQKNVCNTFLRRLFLHQAVLSGVIDSKVSPDKIKPLSIKTGYPFGQHGKLSDAKKVNTLNELSAIIFDYQWDRNPQWAEIIPAEEPLKDWLTETYIDYLKLADNLYRIEWGAACNSFLVTTNDGSVLIDPAGATAVPQYFKRILEKHPLKAVLLTHAHKDHWDNMDVWQLGADVPVIANREFMKYIEYHNRLAPFFERRGAIWGGRQLPDPADAKDWNPPIPTTTFIDEYTYELGGYHFKMTHTPGETPDHSTIYVPELNAVFVGDNYYEYFINNATLRGTSTRPMLGYIDALTLAMSYNPEYFLPGHGAPVISKNIIKETVGNLLDALQYINDETIKGINEGKDVYTLMQEIKVPDEYNIAPYFGKVEWTIRGIYHENIGWFDESPSSMYSTPASEIYPDLVKLAGGADAVIKIAEKYLDENENLKALQLTDAALAAEPDNKSVIEIRLKALQSLLNGPYNYIERIWLDYGIKEAEILLKVENEN